MNIENMSDNMWNMESTNMENEYTLVPRLYAYLKAYCFICGCRYYIESGPHKVRSRDGLCDWCVTTINSRNVMRKYIRKYRMRKKMLIYSYVTSTLNVEVMSGIQKNIHEFC
jgi:hypothetical protein